MHKHPFNAPLNEFVTFGFGPSLKWRRAHVRSKVSRPNPSDREDDGTKSKIKKKRPKRKSARNTLVQYIQFVDKAERKLRRFGERWAYVKMVSEERRTSWTLPLSLSTL